MTNENENSICVQCCGRKHPEKSDQCRMCIGLCAKEGVGMTDNRAFCVQCGGRNKHPEQSNLCHICQKKGLEGLRRDQATLTNAEMEDKYPQCSPDTYPTFKDPYFKGPKPKNKKK